MCKKIRYNESSVYCTTRNTDICENIKPVVASGTIIVTDVWKVVSLYRKKKYSTLN